MKIIYITFSAILIKKNGSDTTAVPTTKPTTSRSPAPLAGIVLGLGAAALLMRMRR